MSQNYTLEFSFEGVHVHVHRICFLSFSVPVRGHTVFWGVEDRNPDWLIPLEGEEVVSEMLRRLDYLIPRYRGR